MKDVYIQKQQEVKRQLEREKMEKLENKIKKMTSSGDKNMFWKERSKIRKDVTGEWLVTKDECGKRLFDPDANLENVANYFERLYEKQNDMYHPYHDIVKECTNDYMCNTEYDDMPYNCTPTKAEVEEVVNGKKNGKSTCDLRNEMIKKGGQPMIDLIYPLVVKFWHDEKAADQWNEGRITYVWKGKGDREALGNQRGITISSAIGTIPEEIINKRLLQIVPFSQFQAGGCKGCSPCDHVFIIRGIISYALKMKQRLFLTFYDVQKAYDRADIADMFHTLWQSGAKGKIWRLARALNVDLTAKVKTKYGLTRKIVRGGGGKQGGQIIVTLFSKLMDTLTEEMTEEEALGIIIENERIANLLFVDDVATLAEGDQ